MKFSSVSMVDQNPPPSAVVSAAVATPTTLADKDIAGLVAPEGKGIVGRIASADAWGNHTYNDSLGNPTSSGPWTTYYNYRPDLDNSSIQFLNMLLGDGMGGDGTSQLLFGNRSANILGRSLQFSNGNRLGHDLHVHYERNQQSYPGYTFACMPIRNTSASPIQTTVYSYSSNYWSAGYEGRALFYFQPNAASQNKKYSEVTGIEGYILSTAGYTSSGAQGYQASNVTVPANTTILVCQSSTHWYHTTYQYVDLNYFTYLQTTFANSNIICDMRMLSALHKSRFQLQYTGSAAVVGRWIWLTCGTDFGDR